MKLSITSVIIGMVLAVSICNAGWTLAKAMRVGELQDFRVYYQATHDFNQQLNPYHSKNYAFIYPPSALPLLWPISWLPIQWSEALWTLLSFFALVITLKILINELKLKPHAFWWLSSVAILFWLFPVKFTFGMGQINLIILALMVAAWQQHLHQKSIWAGILLGLAASLKLFPLMLLAPWVLQKQWKSVVVTGCVFVILHLPAIFMFSPSVLTDFYQVQLSGLPRTGNAEYYNQALTGIMARLELTNDLSSFVNTFLGVCFVLFMLHAKRFQDTTNKAWLYFSLWLCGWLLIGGLAWQHHFVWVIPTLVLLVKNFWKQRDWSSLIYLLLATALIGYNFKTPLTNLASWWLIGSHVTWGNVLLMILLIRELNWRPRPESNRRSSP